MAKKLKPKGLPAPEPAVLVPRAGPPTNVRPAGPHEATAEKKHAEAVRRALQRLDIDNERL